MNPVTIVTPKGERKIGPGEPCFIVAEMSGNHNQQYDKAVEIIKTAAEVGADAIKLQTYTPDTITIDCDKECFIVRNSENPELWKGNKLYDLYKTAYTPWEWQADLKKVAEEHGLVLFSTPFDDTAVDFLEGLHVSLYKIASYEATDFLLLRKITGTGKPVIMSVGFATRDEVDFAVVTLREYGAQDIIVLHCVTEYEGEPNLDAMNLATMIDIRKRWGVISGFSDNNAGIEVPILAAALGASVIEKHFMIGRNEGGPDARFSVEPAEFKEMVRRIRAIESGEDAPDMESPFAKRVLGEVHYGCQSEKEKQNTFFRRSLFVVEDIKKGEPFTEKNVRSIRPSAGMETKYYDRVIGKKADQDIERGTPLSWELIQENA